MSLQKEFELLYSVYAEIKLKYPLFTMVFHATSFSEDGSSMNLQQVQQQIEAYFESQEYLAEDDKERQDYIRSMITGFDVDLDFSNSSYDHYPPLVQDGKKRAHSEHNNNFTAIIYTAKLRAQEEGKQFNIYLQCGANQPDNDNIYDAIAFGAKRIGNGYHIAFQPTLIDEVKERNICIECHPVANFVLG